MRMPWLNAWPPSGARISNGGEKGRLAQGNRTDDGERSTRARLLKQQPQAASLKLQMTGSSLKLVA